MKVLHILNELKPSGAETMLNVAADTFKDNGLQSTVLSTGEIVGNYSVELENNHYIIFHIPFKKQWRFFKQVYNFIQKNKFDAIHLHTERANFWFGITALLATNKPVIRTVHNVFEFEGKLKIVRGLQRRLLSKLGLKHISISISVYENELKRFKNKTTLIPNWYDDRNFKPVSSEKKQSIRDKLGITHQKIVIISVGNASRVKNYSAIIKTIARINSSEIVYLNIGLEDGSKTERKLTKKLNLVDNVQFIGPVNNVHEYLMASDVYIMPSLYEGFGIAAVEALSCGLPCIFSDVPGLKDFKEVVPAFTNLYYCEPNTSSLHGVLTKILASDLSEIINQSEANYINCSKHFGIKNGVGMYLNLYRAPSSK